jgi:hypothetical protein
MTNEKKESDEYAKKLIEKDLKRLIEEEETRRMKHKYLPRRYPNKQPNKPDEKDLKTQK